ncbi:MAG: hypothetical protein QHJ82_03645 [Verrucomicrobiota bacterium]|nr:hypothetical protein [Verrucomicrobiota bacterium]
MFAVLEKAEFLPVTIKTAFLVLAESQPHPNKPPYECHQKQQLHVHYSIWVSHAQRTSRDVQFDPVLWLSVEYYALK